MPFATLALMRREGSAGVSGIAFADACSMRLFFERAVDDMMTGRETWRVMTLLCTAALAISGIVLSW